MKPTRLADLIRQPAPAEGMLPPSAAEQTAPLRAPVAPSPAAPSNIAPSPGAPSDWVAARSRPTAELPDEPLRPPASPAPRVALSAPELEARAAYDLTEEWLGDLFQQARGGDFDAGDVFENAHAIRERANLLDALYAETFRPRPDGRFLPRNALNLAIYSMRLARAIGYEPSALVEIGAAALLAKIGLARVPEELVMKRGQLTRREHLQVQEYPRVGRDMILRKGPGFERVARIVYQVNERIDGSGYPERLHEGEILEPALVVGLVSVFDALVQPRPYRERLLPFAAVKELLERERAHFPRKLLREFVSIFSAFPPFSYVRLNSKAIARVIETEPGHPLRPVLAVVLDASGCRPSFPQTLKLREAPLLYITGPVTEEEISA